MIDSHTWRRLMARWGWVIALQVILLALLAFDLVPALRGYKPWPPEWRWRHEIGANLLWLLPAAIMGGAVLACGWWADRARSRTQKLLCVALLVVTGFLWQTVLPFARTTDPTLSIYQRTTVFFLEDFFHAAARIDSPAEAFTNYEFIRDNYNQNRIATHPPGMIFVYRALIEVSPDAEVAWLPGHPLVFAEEQWPLEGRLRLAAALAAIVKGAGILGVIAGVWLMVTALRRDDPPHAQGRITAAALLVPAIALFTFTLDQVVAGFATLATGAFLHGVAFRRWWSIALAGVAVFLQSLFAWQVSVTIFLTVIASLLLAFHDRRAAGLKSWVTYAAIFAAIPVVLWLLLWAATGYNWFAEFWRGINSHTQMAIHNNRSRAAWLVWNIWDMIWFLGIAFAPWWFSRRTWKLGNNPLLTALLVTWTCAILLADAVRGETARILLPLFPVFVVALLVNNTEQLEKEEYPLFGILLLLQTLVFVGVLNLF